MRAIIDAGSIREAASMMARADVGRLPVVARGTSGPVLGMLTRSDVIKAHVRITDVERIQPSRLGSQTAGRKPRKRGDRHGVA